MSTSGICPRKFRWLPVIAAAVLLALPMSGAFGQNQEQGEPAVSAAAGDGAASDEAEASADDDSAAGDAGTAQQVAENDAAPSGAATEGEEPSGEESAEAPAPDAGAAEETGTATTGTTPAGTTAPPESGFDTEAIMLGVIIIALFVVPVLIGNLLASWLRMPDHAWKLSLVLGTLAASIVIVSMGQFRFGPDLAGGITLIYEIENTQALGGGDGATSGAFTGGRSVQMQEAIEILKKRIDPTGTREVTIREYGPAVEIIIPQTGQDALIYVKKRITQLGQLEFRITADPRQPDPQERTIIEQAKLLPPARKDVVIAGRKVAEWVAYAPEEFGPVDVVDERGIVKRLAGDTPEALVLTEPDSVTVTGEYLASVNKGVDDHGGPAVHFSFNNQGARLFQRLTSRNKPDRATGAQRYLGIMLDKRLLSAPSIRETIFRSGIISGSTMTDKEVESVVSVLREGKLPIQLSKEPISEEVISPTLGATTIEKGEDAIVWSFFAVMAFMLFYYRFAGIVACFALGFNLLLVLALMVLIQAAFTLPGLAGLVLTIGMSVDANVLIFERMREEFRGGAAFRMVIRNGFGRAMSAIIDSNVTTIISGVALYVIGTDQVKGFAVTLILGIITSMYTAIFCSRLVFDVVERQGWVKSVRMWTLMTQTNIDFLRGRYVAGLLSFVLIAVCVAAMFFRGTRLLDIDFTGGSSVTFALTEESKLPIADVRAALVQTELADKNLLVVERGETQTRYSIDTSEQSVDEVKNVIGETFAGKLQMFSVEVGPLEPFTDGDYRGTRATLVFNRGPGYDPDDGISYDALSELIRETLEAEGHQGVVPALDSPEYRPGTSARIQEWTVRLGDLDAEAAGGVFGRLKSDLEQTPLFPLANKIGGRVSGNMQMAALQAIFFSMLGIIAYLWLRFQKVIYGLAAAAALVHDVLVSVGMLALSAYIVNAVPGFASALQIDSFQISLTIVAAILTIMGFSLNDTIVIFDRIREVRGKRPNVTAEIVNLSLNQTLSRTILTSLTVFIVVVILYFFGGDGIHGFAFTFLVGIISGTYSTIYIASPILVWLSGPSAAPDLT